MITSSYKVETKPISLGNRKTKCISKENTNYTLLSYIAKKCPILDSILHFYPMLIPTNVCKKITFFYIRLFHEMKCLIDNNYQKYQF